MTDRPIQYPLGQNNFAGINMQANQQQHFAQQPQGQADIQLPSDWQQQQIRQMMANGNGQMGNVITPQVSIVNIIVVAFPTSLSSFP